MRHDEIDREIEFDRTTKRMLGEYIVSFQLTIADFSGLLAVERLRAALQPVRCIGSAKTGFALTELERN
jgi:hypothetical protein